MQTQVKTAKQINAMRDGGQILAKVLQIVKTQVQAGVSTKQLAAIAAREVSALGGVPTILGYQDFPDVICISVNEEVVHGIPKADKFIKAGDIVSLDFCVTYKGMITDAALSVIAPGGKPNQAHIDLLKYTEQSLYTGIDAVYGQVRVGDISAAIEPVLKRRGYGVVRDLVGHGVGNEMHEDPNIPNYGRAKTGPWLQAGMTIAIEPMATLGTHKVYLADDGWTIMTRDNSWAAHFEHTVLITEDGAEILTQLR